MCKPVTLVLGILAASLVGCSDDRPIEAHRQGTPIAASSDQSTTHPSPPVQATDTIESCASCHGHNGPPNAAHADSTVNFGGNLNSAMNAVNIDTVTPDCSGGVSNNGCHDAAGSSEWNTGSLGANRCTDCHASAGSMGRNGFPPSTGARSTAWRCSKAVCRTAGSRDGDARGAR